ncbi:MAG: outer membrane protein assembly factor BamE, partial [Pseudomonadota bacterium]
LRATRKWSPEQTRAGVVDKLMHYGIMRAAMRRRCRKAGRSDLSLSGTDILAPPGVSQMRRSALASLFLAVALTATPGCVYRLAIQQGNIAEREDVEQVKVGMTPSQVRFLLGTPLVDDPFSEDRWDYIYYVRIGRNQPTTRHFLTVYFEDGKVARLETKDAPPTE